MSNESLNTSELSQELIALLALLHVKSDDTKNLDEVKQAFKHLDWEQLLLLSLHHRIFPMIHLKLKPLLSSVPAQVVRSFALRYQHNTYKMMHLSAEMIQISSLLSNGGIRLLQLKGPALAQDLYGDISARTSIDLDMMIHVDDLNKVEERLISIGYEKDDYIRTVLNDWKWRHHHITFKHPVKGIKLEIHWRLNPGPGKEPSFDELWSRRRVSALGHKNVYLLSREDLFLFLVTHGARHGWSRLRWLDDIKQMILQPLDWSIAYRLFKRYHYDDIAGQAICLASQLLGAKVPFEMQHFVDRTKSKRLSQAALFYLKNMIHLHSPPLPKEIDMFHKRYLFALMPLQQKLLFLISFLHPYPEDAQTLPLPKKLHFLYFPLRPILWSWRKWKQV